MWDGKDYFHYVRNYTNNFVNYYFIIKEIALELDIRDIYTNSVIISSGSTNMLVRNML